MLEEALSPNEQLFKAEGRSLAEIHYFFNRRTKPTESSFPGIAKEHL